MRDLALEEDLTTDLSILQSHLDGMINRVQHNSNALRRFQAFERRLLNLNSLSEMIVHILEDGKAFFDLDVISLCLVDKENELSEYLIQDGFDIKTTKQLTLLKDRHQLKTLFGFAVKPYIGAYHPKCSEFFSYTDRKPISVALIPLIRRGKYLGSLNFGSFQQERFIDTMATDFIEHMISVVSICLENNLNFEMMRRTSLIDTLTGVNNRRFLEQRLGEEIDRCQRSGEPLSCLFLDIDYFKSINDTHGHQAGDYVLKQVSGSVKNLLRNNDVLARYGGEEFVALLSNLDESKLIAIAERIRCTVEALNMVFDGKPIQVTISIGAASYSAPKHILSSAADIAMRLIESADAALYQAKHNGRNRIENNGFIIDRTSIDSAASY
ncbi:sensor domain-containing diguanylate cyclase [Methylotuvimicrobium buryatense]|uniref:sensor domain-containing diguanylate cyclase n=1 Tax=Methylotuvimicrobium buryatense TaxID=95641 RepID=UPI00034776B2|nr:sensor domain-containing diguanylate cyclase [Methylotuvimicrobium buryatense]